MSEYIEKGVLKLKLLTPVHISDGYEGELMPTEYVVTDSGELHKINLARLINRIPEDRMALLNECLENEDIIGIRDFVRLLWGERQDLFSDSIEYSMSAGDLHEYHNNLRDENEASQFMVTPFIRTAKRTFIPGSSVKGALRTASISEMFKREGISVPLNKPRVDIEAQKLEADTLKYSYRDKKNRWKINATKDPLKALKLSDTFVPPGNGIIKKIEIVRKINAGQFDVAGMKGMKIFAEFIKKGVEVDVDISLDNRYFEIPWKIGKRISFRQIADSCRAFYERVLKHEKKEFFGTFDKQLGKSRISDLYDEFLTLNSKQNSFLVRLGKHSGRNSLSFNLRNKKGVEPKSRKLVLEDGEYWPVGWACVAGI